MFTGIIQELGTVMAARPDRGVIQFSIRAPKTASGVRAGESVAINGVCLSIVRVRQGTMGFEMIAETRRVTNLDRLVRGSRVNVERSVTLNDRLNGHLVLGHVDGVGRVVRRRRQRGAASLTIRADRTLARYVVPKGPIALDGVSLTVGTRLRAATFSVYLIPETLKRTTLGTRQVGDLVNIEGDYLAKVIHQLVLSDASGAKHNGRPRHRRVGKRRMGITV